MAHLLLELAVMLRCFVIVSILFAAAPADASRRTAPRGKVEKPARERPTVKSGAVGGKARYLGRSAVQGYENFEVSVPKALRAQIQDAVRVQLGLKAGTRIGVGTGFKQVSAIRTNSAQEHPVTIGGITGFVVYVGKDGAGKPRVVVDVQSPVITKAGQALPRLPRGKSIASQTTYGGKTYYYLRSYRE